MYVMAKGKIIKSGSKELSEEPKQKGMAGLVWKTSKTLKVIIKYSKTYLTSFVSLTFPHFSWIHLVILLMSFFLPFCAQSCCVLF